MGSRPNTGGFEHFKGNGIMEQTYISQISLLNGPLKGATKAPKQEARDTQIDFYYARVEFPQLIFLEKTVM